MATSFPATFGDLAQFLKYNNLELTVSFDEYQWFAALMDANGNRVCNFADEFASAVIGVVEKFHTEGL